MHTHRMFAQVSTNRTTEVTIWEHSDRETDRRWYTIVEQDRRPWMRAVRLRTERIDDPAGWRSSCPRDPQCPARLARQLAAKWLDNGPYTDATWYAGHPSQKI